jgi:uncharacterized protein YukE
MAEKKDQNTGMNLGELSTIRNILMGQQMNEYDERFGELEKLVSDAEDRINQKINALEEASNKKLSDLQAEMTQKLEKLENALMENVSSINQKMEATSREDKHQLGAFLSEIGKKLMDA